MNNSIAQFKFPYRMVHDVFIVGSGTSLVDFNYQRLARVISIALNDAVKHFLPNWHIFSDNNLAKRYLDMDPWPELKVVTQKAGRDALIKGKHWRDRADRVYTFNRVGKIDKMLAPEDFYVNRTVATGAICLARLLGARRIYLLGIDAYCRPDRYYCDREDGKPVKQYPTEVRPDGRLVQVKRHGEWVKEMQALKDWLVARGECTGKHPAPGVYNLSEFSEVTAWDKVPIDEVLP